LSLKAESQHYVDDAKIRNKAANLTGGLKILVSALLQAHDEDKQLTLDWVAEMKHLAAELKGVQNNQQFPSFF
jgi:hypothetical protein